MSDLTFTSNLPKYILIHTDTSLLLKIQKSSAYKTLVFFSVIFVFFTLKLSTLLGLQLVSFQLTFPLTKVSILLSFLFFHYLPTDVIFHPHPLLLSDFNGTSLTKHQTRDTVQRKQELHKKLFLQACYLWHPMGTGIVRHTVVSVNCLLPSLHQLFKIFIFLRPSTHLPCNLLGADNSLAYFRTSKGH